MSSISNTQKILFWIITITFPLIIIALIEIGLRVGGYNSESRDLFVELPGKTDYFATNPQYVGRYFPSFIPQIAPSPFKKIKADNTFRVFVFGGSSTQGFPYNFYHSFSARLEQKLLMETQGLDIEVINLGMTAVNSYVIWDLSEKIVEYEPDAVIIYAGHNEYYGSFGVGSSQFGIGKIVSLKRLIITLKDFAIYQFIEGLFKPEKTDTDGRTMMAKVVSESNIDLNDDIYNAGIEQFNKNIGDVLGLFNKNKIPVFIGTLASNLKDQQPLGENVDAKDAFKKANSLLNSGNIELAREEFLNAKELDEIRFRAPNDINESIKILASNYNAEVIDVFEVSMDSSVSGVADNSFFTDHLHPNWRGNQIIGDLFFDGLKDKTILSEYYLPNPLLKKLPLSRFEYVYSRTPILRLTAGYPFQKGLSEEKEYANFQREYNRYMANSYIDSLAVTTWRLKRQTVFALTDVINYEKQTNNLDGIVEHYLPLSYWQIYNESLLKKGIALSVPNRKYDPYNAFMLHLILNKAERKDLYFINSLAAIYLLNKDLIRSEYWLTKSEKLNPENPELLYNLARFHVLAGDTTKAQQYYTKYIKYTQQN